MTEIGKSEAENSLSDKMARHVLAYVATVKEAAKPEIDTNLLRRAFREEEGARTAIVLHEPVNQAEKDRKLTYIAAYLIASRGTLKPEEMEAVLQTAGIA